MIFNTVSSSPEAAISHHCYGIAIHIVENKDLDHDVLGSILVVDMVQKEGSCIAFRAYSIEPGSYSINVMNGRLDDILLCTGETDVDKLMTYARVCTVYDTLVVTSFDLKDSTLYPSEMSFIQPRQMVERYTENQGVIRIQP
jgi:hypothetical protein